MSSNANQQLPNEYSAAAPNLDNNVLESFTDETVETQQYHKAFPDARAKEFRHEELGLEAKYDSAQKFEAAREKEREIFGKK